MSKHSAIHLAEFNMRDEPRKRVLMQATIITVDGPQRAFVKDLTPAGARIQCKHPLKEGWDVVFKRGDDFRAAGVAWVSNEEAGLRFYREPE